MASNAALKSACVNSSAAMWGALRPSKRAVYYSTAASPRFCTSARMSATRCSMAASVSADQCRRAAKSASKVAAAVDRRAGAATKVIVRSTVGSVLGGRDGRSKRINDAAQRCLLEFERGLVDHEVGADVHDALHLHQVVGLERVAGGHQVDDGIGQADERRQFHAAVKLDHVDMHALGGKEVTRNRRVLGGDLQARALLDSTLVVEVVAHGNAHAALGNLQVQRLVQPLATVFDQGVLAGHADVGTAVFHVGGHVGGTHQHHAHVGLVGGQDELARLFGVFQHLDARGG